MSGRPAAQPGSREREEALAPLLATWRGRSYIEEDQAAEEYFWNGDVNDDIARNAYTQNHEVGAFSDRSTRDGRFVYVSVRFEEHDEGDGRRGHTSRVVNQTVLVAEREPDKWVYCGVFRKFLPGQRLLPTELRDRGSSHRVLVPLGNDLWRVDNSLLKSKSQTLAYRSRKKTSAKITDVAGPVWGSVIEGTGGSDGWVRVTKPPPAVMHISAQVCSPGMLLLKADDEEFGWHVEREGPLAGFGSRPPREVIAEELQISPEAAAGLVIILPTGERLD